MKSIGERIKEMRDIRGLTQQQLADKLGESSGRVIYNWEKGIARPDSDKISRLCIALQISADELLGCVEWLLNDEKAGFVTGITVPVDGGFLASAGV